LSALESLNINYNQLRDVPISIRRCYILDTLLLAHNDIRSLSNGIAALKALRTLDISHNPIKELPLTMTSIKGSVRNSTKAPDSISLVVDSYVL